MPKELKGVMIEKGTGGGHTVMHHFTHYDHPSEGPHVFGATEGKKLQAHLAGLGIIPAAGESAGSEENVAAKEGAEL